ncbi:MAG: peptidase S8 and S53 subtilisin kexin sedolisin [Actinobacteria bacterium]|nr:MAG: peptidase S8 and S53 subtilisin kexin sedolisin [Actinomycetota bacterium]
MIVSRRAGAAAAVALVAGAVFGPAAAGAAPGTASAHPHGHWRFDSSATTVTDVARVIGADKLWHAGSTGDGVGVALVDTGVVPVPGLRADHVVNGPDLSLDSVNGDARYLDTYGHGTHLAGIVDGIAPGAMLTSVKVGAADGAVDVSQVLAGLDWVVAHRNDDPRHPVRVVNLSFGTDGSQDYRIDPLTHAVENAWRAGIVVVVAAGNGGTAGALTDPAYDPYVLAVGAADTNGTVGSGDDVVADFSSRGSAARRPDLVAPGRSIVSLRDPGSFVDVANPTARVGDDLFKGSGTSQAAAVVSGAVALLLQARPELTPDQVKAALTRSAFRLPGGDGGQGAGELNLARAVAAPVAGAGQNWARSTGTGSIDAARGSAQLSVGGDVLTGENSLWGPFDAATWARASSAGTAWVGGRWMGHELAGADWHGTSWAGRTWSGLYWSGQTWSGLYWSGLYWSGLYWSGLYWSGGSWDGLYWSGLYWSGLYWSDQSWSG